MGEPQITLHHCPQTRSMRTLWLLHELGVPFEVQVWPFDKTLRSEAFLALNPAGRVPAVQIDGETWWETGAITQLLCERFPAAGLMPGPGEPNRAEALIWLHFAETISQHAAALTQQHIVLYDDAMRSPIVMKLEAARLAKCWAALEAQLTGRDYLAGAFGAADISVGQAVYMGRHFATLDDCPAVGAWYARLVARPAFAASLPVGEERLYTRDFYGAWA
ncbi:MAG: glutathione S-transferase family protein [Shimia sp.]